MTRFNYVLLLIVLLPCVSAAAMPENSMQVEVEYLLGAVDKDSCTFIRNDISYSNDEFQQHLRSKLRENDSLISSAEDFILKIGTRSSVSESPYVAICGGELQIMKDWLTELLESYRAGN